MSLYVLNNMNYKYIYSKTHKLIHVENVNILLIDYDIQVH